MCAQHIISRLLAKWQEKKLEHDARHLQQEADKENLLPLWKYQRALKGTRKKDRNYTLNKTDGTKTKTPLERQQRWTEWITQQFSVPVEQEIPKNMYIPSKTWTNITQGNIRHGAQGIPKRARTNTPEL